MPYHLYIIRSESFAHSDIVWADTKSPDRDAYTHLAYVIEAPDNKHKILDRRGIRFRNLRHWTQSDFRENIKDDLAKFQNEESYNIGECVLSKEVIKHKHYIGTVLKLGSLEILANLYSGRITASDKDPFPHQLAFKQYFKNNEFRVKRILLADEVGLGKTIEVGLILRDKLIAQKDDLRCLYLTSGGLKQDVKEKLKSVIKDTGDESIITVVDSFKEYGDSISQRGIRIASMHAARGYYEIKSKKELPNGVKPNVIIIDECHHCNSDENLNSEDVNGARETTHAYKAAYQMITGKFWNDSEVPELVILMSATPFRSANQFTNLLRLLAHKTAFPDAYSNVEQKQILDVISNNESPITVIWRQQEEIRNWKGDKLFPKLTIVRPHKEGNIRLEKTNEEYLETLEAIKNTVQKIYRNHGKSFRGFQGADLETRLTSSSVAGACWLFRWCVAHHSKWQNKEIYKADNSEAINQMRLLIREISKQLSSFDKNRESKYAEVVIFPSDNNFDFKSSHLNDGSIPQIYDFQKEIFNNRKKKDNENIDSFFEAEPDEIIKMSQLALDFLASGKTVDNAKLNWLQEMLNEYRESRFLVFTDVLQTTTIITSTLPNESLALVGSMSNEKRKEVIQKFYNPNNNYRVLVATSAADEGLDFQVANRVVHWDLSPDPSALMQRNGRVARLGQVSDVISYYLILEGTLAEKRDSALYNKLMDAGIEDPQMQLKILGQIETKDLDDALDNDKPMVVDDILNQARRHSELMESQLRKLNEILQPQWVLDRDKLLKRLKVWHSLECINFDPYKHKISFEEREWLRPIFGDEGTTMEPAIAEVIAIQHHKNRKHRFNFDPDFGLFGQDKNLHGLAGLLPWLVKDYEEGGKREHKPLLGSDPLGTLCQSLARQNNADFLAVNRKNFNISFPELAEANFLIFATHPLRELENQASSECAKYLTYYVFHENQVTPINETGASSQEVHKMITFFEKEIGEFFLDMLPNEIEKCRSDSKLVTKWLHSVLNIGTQDIFGGVTQYFVPVPVAFVALIDRSA
jgi:superfamily II DNA or RNA helicase